MNHKEEIWETLNWIVITLYFPELLRILQVKQGKKIYRNFLKNFVNLKFFRDLT